MCFSSNSDTFEVTTVLRKKIIITALTFVSPYYCEWWLSTVWNKQKHKSRMLFAWSRAIIASQAFGLAKEVS